MSLVRRGFCHVYGDNVPLDEGVMPFKYAIERVIDPDKLIPHLFEGYDADFQRRVKPGDFIVAGSQFCSGKVHMQGLLAMAALRMNVLCGSMPYKAHRRAISEGIGVLTGCAGAGEFARTGDEIEVDFASGQARNLTRGTQAQFPPMPPILRDLITSGGAKGALQAWLRDHPEQAGVAEKIPQGEPVAILPRVKSS